jgi:hypothetical protein
MLRKQKHAAPREVPAWKLAMERAERGDEAPPVDDAAAAETSGVATVKEDDHRGVEAVRSVPHAERSRSRERERRSRSREREHRSRSRSRSQERERRSRSREREHHSRSRERDDNGAAFLPSATFAGARRGYVFKRGPDGLGYYLDAGSFAGAAAAEEEQYSSALQAGPAHDEDSPDAPIVAALASHRTGLDEAEAACARLEGEARSWGRASSALSHSAQVVEVRLTDQLLLLTRMLDDCSTADGRAAVKAVVARLKGLGSRLSRLSGRG